MRYESTNRLTNGIYICLTELKNETLRHWYAVGNVGISVRDPKMLLETWNFCYWRHIPILSVFKKEINISKGFRWCGNCIRLVFFQESGLVFARAHVTECQPLKTFAYNSKPALTRQNNAQTLFSSVYLFYFL